MEPQNLNDLTESPLHPFVFVTRDANWPATTNRLVTVFSNDVKLRAGTQVPSEKKVLASALTLDENYASFTSPTDKLKAYSVEIGTPAARDQFQKYIADIMLWPLESAEKIARQFSDAPFDDRNTAFLKDRISALYGSLPPGSHPVARSVLARTSHAIDAKVDNLGFYQYYVPRISFLQTLKEFVSLQGDTLTTLEAWDKEIVAAQKGSDLSGMVQSLDSNVGGLKVKLVSDQKAIDDAVNDLAVKENTISSLAQVVDRSEAEIKAQIADDKKKQETNKNIAIGTKVDQQAVKALPPSGLLDSAVTIEKDFGEAAKVVQKLMADNSQMVQKYNSLLAIAQSQDAQLQAANSRQQRINNALAFYSMMPKYTPPQTINLQVTNCSAYPALCVH